MGKTELITLRIRMLFKCLVFQLGLMKDLKKAFVWTIIPIEIMQKQFFRGV